MTLAHFFIDRPVFASVISLVTVIVGLIALVVLPVAQYPEIAPPTVVVTASYPGANARTVADTVAAPIEEQVNGVENMLYMSSQSSNDGQLQLTITFAVGTDLDDAQVQVQNRVALAEPKLPEDVRRLGVNVEKRSPDITLVAQLYSPDGRYDTLYMSNFAELQIRDQLARLPGVGAVRVFGARQYSMRVWLDPMKLAARRLTASDVVSAIREQNVQVAAGVLGREPLTDDAVDFELTVNAQGRLAEPEQFGQIVVRTGDDGRVIRIDDVGRVELGAADYGISTFLNGHPAVALAVFQLPGSNSIDTADAVYSKMKQLKASFPDGLEFIFPYDTTVFVRQSMYDVAKTLIEAVLLVALVVLVFLQGWRASVIPLLAVPVSIIGTCAVMWAMGFSLNNLTLFGLVLAIGIVVDDAIVVVENVERWIERGETPRQAAYHAMHEVTPAVIAIAFGLSAVFIPVAFISGITGQFYRQFALTIAVATLISAINSLTLSPALAAIILHPRHERPDVLARVIHFSLGWFFNLFNRAFAAGTHAYVSVLRRVLRLAVIALVVYVGLVLLTGAGFRMVPSAFIPQQDMGYLLVNVQLPDAAATHRTEEMMLRLSEIASQTPGIDNVFAITGFSLFTGAAQSNAGTMFIILDDFHSRAGKPELGDTAIAAKLMGQYSQIQEGVATVFPAPPVRGVGAAGGFKMQVQDRAGTGTAQELEAAVASLLSAARQDPRLSGLFSSFRANVPQLYVDIDRVKVKKQDVRVSDVFNTLQVYLGGLYVNDFNFLGRTFRVMAQADSAHRARAPDIAQLQTRNAAGRMVPLGAVVDVRDVTGPDRVNRYNLYASAEINGAAAPGVSTGQALSIMEDLAREHLPPGYGFEWTELSYQERLAGNTAYWIFPLCVLFVWLTHSAEYESFALSTAIILIVPMCLLSGIFGVWLLGQNNNIFTQIGFVVLAGLSAKNAVLIVEFAKQQQEQGLTPFDAVLEAARLRLRPILMTSFAFILGVVPLVIATGAGAEMRRALGTVVFFGMLGVTNFGIFLTPVFYVVIRWITGKLGTHRHYEHRKKPAPARV